MAHAFKQVREYQPDAPLYAREHLKFSGRPVERGAIVPAEYFRTPEQRRSMWQAGKVDHLATSPYTSPSPSAAPAALPAATAQAAEAATIDTKPSARHRSRR